MCLFYSYANAKIEIHICSNKHETGLVLLACKRMIRSHFAGDVSEQGDMQKVSFQRWCQERTWLSHPSKHQMGSCEPCIGDEFFCDVVG